MAIGPNNSGSAGAAASTGSDPDLQLLIPGYDVYDKAVLEFDFVPIADTIRFRYVFGSEEFLEFCNSSFNDVFGFFVSGPGLNGPFSNNAINIALMPGSSQYVTIDNVCGAPAYYYDNNAGLYIQYDAFTVVLTAWVVVQACQQYHIKIAIGDAGDSAYDSGVFIEANSFSSNGLSYNTSYTSNIDTVAVEGCNNAIISFMLNDPATDSIFINYFISGTATPGLDYPAVPNSLVILPGQDSAFFMITPISDGIAEPTETVIISYINTVCGSMDTIIILIKDYTPISTQMIPDTVHNCNGTPANLSVSAADGYPPLTYVWSDGVSTSNSTVVNPVNPTMYYVSVSDECNFTVIDSVMVSISNLSSSISNVDSITCYNYSDGSITVDAVDGIQPYTYIWSPGGQTTSTIDLIGAGTWFVTVTDAIGCTSTNAVILNNPAQVSINLTPTDEGCFMSCDGQITSDIGGTPQPPYSYLWSTSPPQTTATASGLCPGNYVLTLTYSPNNCTIVSSAANIGTNTQLQSSFFTVPSPAQGYVPFIVNFTFDGYGADTYLWDFGDGSSSNLPNPVHTYNDMGIYNVTLTINSGAPDYCTSTYTLQVTAIQPSSMNIPNVFTPNGDGRNDAFSVESEGIRTFSIVVYNRWGKKVHETTVNEAFSDKKSVNPVWDGKNMGGADCADGTYFYIIKAVGYDSKEYEFNGTIQLLR